MPHKSRTGTDQRAGSREWVGLAVLALPTLLLALDFSVLFLALPHLTADLGASSTQSLWIMDIYGFMIAGFLVTMGTLGDRIGRRKLLMIGACAFGLASVLAAYSSSVEMLIAARAVLGVAGATLMPSILALLSTMFTDAQQRGMAVAVIMSCFMGGNVIGPLVGGVLLENFWWGSVFLLGVPVMVLLLVIAPLVLPEYRVAGAGRLDLASVALSLAAILPIVYGLKEIAKTGPQLWQVVAIVAGLALGTAFVVRQRRLADPLLDLRLFDNRSFSAALGMLVLCGLTAGFLLFVTLYLQAVEGLTPFEAGLWLTLPALAAVAGSLLAPVLARRMRPAQVIAAGMAFALGGYLLLTQLDRAWGPTVLVIGFAIVSAGSSPVLALSTDLVIGSAPPEKAGSAGSLVETGAQLGIALGVATLGSVGTALYRGQIVVPTEVPAAAAETAREGIASATLVAGQLPSESAAGLLRTAHDAFLTGLHAAAGISGALTVVIGVLAVTALRHVRPSGKADQPDNTSNAATEKG